MLKASELFWKMARNSEKANSMLNRMLAAKQEEKRGGP
jgi:hypothetical protein